MTPWNAAVAIDAPAATGWILGQLEPKAPIASMSSFTATASVDFPRRPDGRLHVVPVVASVAGAVLSIRPAGPDQRHHLAATAGANAYAHLPDGPAVPAGATVHCGSIAGTNILASGLGSSFR